MLGGLRWINIKNAKVVNVTNDDDEDIIIHMESGDVFLFLQPFEAKRSKIKKVFDGDKEE